MTNFDPKSNSFKLLICSILLTGAFISILARSVHADPSGFTIGTFDSPSVRTAVVFVPGVMGSRIDQEGENVWGDFPINPNTLVLANGVNGSEASPMDSVVVAGFNLSRQAYGDFFHGARSVLDAADWFSPFSYDWRQSNEISADQLAAHICEVTDNGREPLRLVAHSMGTIVIRLWIMNSYHEGCPEGNGAPVQIESILMVAPPTLGAPQAVMTLLTGDADLFPVLENVFTNDFGTIGLTFQSLFELLPMQHAYKDRFKESDMCVGSSGRRAGEPTRYRVFYRPAVGNNRVLDIFSASSWLQLGLLSRLENLRDNYGVQIGDPEVYLQRRLDSARRVACKLQTTEFPDVLRERTVTIAGQTLSRETPVNSTVDSILVSDIKQSSPVPELVIKGTNGQTDRYVYVNRLPGDETVPLDIAEHLAGDRRYRETGDHLELMNSYRIQEILSTTIDRARLRLEGGSTFAGFGTVTEPLTALQEMAWRASPVFDEAQPSDLNSLAYEWIYGETTVGRAFSNGIDLGVLSRSPDYFSRILSETSSWTANSSGMVPLKIISGLAGTNEDVLATAMATGSAYDLHIAAMLSGLSDSERGTASTLAANAYLEQGDVSRATDLYGFARDVFKRAVESGQQFDSSLVSRASAGHYVLQNYSINLRNSSMQVGPLNTSEVLAAWNVLSAMEIEALIAQSRLSGSTFEVDLRSVIIENSN